MQFKMMLIVVLVSLSSFANANDGQIKNEIRDLTRAGHVPRSSYSDSRKVIMQQVHIKQDKQGYFVKDVYCRIKFRKKISPRTMPNANNVNIEHTWPRSRFNKSENYNHQLADLHHLYPTDSKSNSTRGNHYFGEFPAGEIVHDDCTSSHRGTIRATGNTGFEPPEEHKGNVARTLFYFSIRYNLRLPAYEELVLRRWNAEDPVDEEEMKRNNLVESIQGNRNPFVDDPELAIVVDDF